MYIVAVKWSELKWTLCVGLHQFWFLAQIAQEDVESYYEAYICMGTMFDESDLKVKQSRVEIKTSCFDFYPSIPLHISITLPRSKHCNAELPLRAGLICAT